jgi:putative ABC transport system permease protein
MTRWMLKTLWRQKGSLFSSASGIAAAFVLVIILDAAFVGESNQIVSYIRHTNPAVWVLQKGVSNMHMATTFVWDWKVDRVAELPGVKQTTPILYVNTVVKAGERNWFAFVVGLKPDSTRAGPWDMAAGRALPRDGEIVLPGEIADATGVQLGDKASIADQSFTVVGFSKGTFSMANSIAFVSFSDLEDLLSASGTVSFILVDAEPGQESEELAQRIESSVDKVSAIPQERFIKNDFQIALLMGVEVISFMTIIGSALAGLIVAFTVYTQVSRRRRELAIAKALGFRNHSLYAVVIMQSLVVTGLAVLIAFLAVAVLAPAITAAAPMVTLDVTPNALLRVSIIAFAVAILAAMIPTYLVARVDPMSAFKV